MVSFLLASILGIVTATVLPLSGWWVLFLGIGLALWLRANCLPALKNAAKLNQPAKHRCRQAWALLLVFGLSGVYGQWWLNQQLERRLSSADDRTQASLLLEIEQVIPRERGVRVLARVGKILSPTTLPPLRRVQLNWYEPSEAVRLGSLFRAEVVLRSPRNFTNGLAFDYEAFLLSRGIDATGYVRKGEWLQDTSTGYVRERFLAWQQSQHQAEAWPWLAGLVFGEQSSFSAEQWRLAQTTGTLHILVVSGMHVGIVALLGLALFAVGQRVAVLAGLSSAHLVWWRAAWLIALCALYVWVAGMGVPLQRALFMLSMVTLLQCTRFSIPWPLMFWVALAVVLWSNPMAMMRPGTSYSFLAVGVLLAFFVGRKSQFVSGLWLPQWIIFLALLPLLLLWNMPVSPVHMLTNLWAIPFTSFVLLPLALLNTLFPIEALNQAVVWVGEAFWWGLRYMEHLSLPWLLQQSLFWLLGWYVLLWLMWRGVDICLVGTVVGLLLILLFSRAMPNVAQARMLDVGQGQALLFSTAQHALMYDVGPRFSASFDAGDAIVKPLLMQQGVHQLDALIISHADNDHAGGAQALLQGPIKVKQWWVGQPLDLDVAQSSCHDVGNDWTWLSPQLLYRFLPLDDISRERIRTTRNNASCVAQVSWFGKLFLLTGDIDQQVERALIHQYGEALQSDVLIVSHHGSRSSSSRAFLQAVNPKEAWISAGFNNAFHHPHSEVITLLESLGVDWYVTAQSGALLIHPQGTTKTLRTLWQPRWRQP